MAEMLAKILEKSSEIDRMRSELEAILRILQTFLEPASGPYVPSGTRCVRIRGKAFTWEFTFYVLSQDHGNKRPRYRVRAGGYVLNPPALVSGGGPEAVRAAHRDADAMIKAVRKQSKAFDEWIRNLVQE